MIEILILYVIYVREKTIYSIRKEIIEKFGNLTKPSLGTIHPALKRLLSINAVKVSDKMSDGGKKSSYYLITEEGKKVFKEIFFKDGSKNPSLFYGQLHARFGTIGLLNKEDRTLFLDTVVNRIERYTFEMKNKLNDEFISLDFYQQQLLKSTIDEANRLKDFAIKFKEYECPLKLQK